MRVNLGVLAVSLLLVTSAFAGNITASNNQVTWASTQCTAPSDFVPIAAPANKRRSAEEANKRVTAYNEYVQKVQDYMDCVSREAQADATTVSQSITASAQKTIEEQRKKTADAASTLTPPSKK
jgi:hypothetical protein